MSVTERSIVWLASSSRDNSRRNSGFKYSSDSLNRGARRASVVNAFDSRIRIEDAGKIHHTPSIEWGKRDFPFLILRAWLLRKQIHIRHSPSLRIVAKLPAEYDELRDSSETAS